MMTVEDIARICHEANLTYCRALKDHSQLPWEHAPEWQRNSAIMGVAAIVSGSVKHPKDSHESWMKQKLSEGWVHGEIKDPEKKTHPCIKPWLDLPDEQKRKDMLFLAIVNALTKEIPTP